jgi:two-component system, OmpR family, phosphate regulon response regulator PhoB
MRSPLFSAGPADFRPECILLADPDVELQQQIHLALTQDGYEVWPASNGQAVLDILMQAVQAGIPRNPDVWVPDLLILDTALPDMSGLELCRQLRQQRFTLPILMTSTKSSEVDRVVGLELGADDYLIKPFGIRELVARSRSLLRRGQRLSPTAMPETLFSFQEILIYPDACRATCRGVELTLSPKEFRLLELLTRYPRRVWTREQLLEQIWGSDFVGDTKTVDVHIRWLREKLEADPSQPQYIQTVRGFGYRLG